MSGRQPRARAGGPALRASVTTSFSPGAVAVVQLEGEVEGALTALTGRPSWPLGHCALVEVPDVDELVAVRLTPRLAQLMPHGGPRVVQRLLGRLGELGAETVVADELDPRSLYPEAQDDVEALMLAALARTESLLAIDLLLDQPRRWRPRPALSEEDLARSRRLNRLIAPPRVVLVGPPNVGKSTLGNALAGRPVSIESGEAGTTRDYVASFLQLGGLAVIWHDTPGLRAAADPLEQAAIRLAERLVAQADCLVAMTDAAHDWPELPRTPDLRVASRADLGRRTDADVIVSVHADEGLERSVQAVRDALVPPEDLAHPGPWVFDARLLTERR